MKNLIDINFIWCTWFSSSNNNLQNEISNDLLSKVDIKLNGFFSEWVGVVIVSNLEWSFGHPNINGTDTRQMQY